MDAPLKPAAGAEDTIERLIRAIEDDRAAAARKSKLLAGLLAVLVLFSAGYMSWIYSSVAQLDAESLSGIAATEVEKALPDFKAGLKRRALEAAPEIMARGKELILAAPREGRLALEAALTDGSIKLIAGFEKEMDEEMAASLADQIDLIRAEQPAGTNAQRLDALLRRSRTAHREILEDGIDELYVDYSREMRRLDEYFARLRNSPGLTEREKLHKEIIETWIALVHTHELTTPKEEDPQDD